MFGRFDMPAAQSLLDTLEDAERRPAVLPLPGYHKLKRERVDCVETITLSSSDVVLLEGVGALALKTANPAQTHRFHVYIDEKERKRRVINEYRLRGLAEDRALQIYFSRKADEFQTIEDFARGARGICLSSAGEPVKAHPRTTTET